MSDATIHTEPTATIEWSENEKETIQKVVAAHAKMFRETTIEWANHLSNTTMTATYTIDDLVMLSAMMRKWADAEDAIERSGYLTTVARETADNIDEIVSDMIEAA